MNSNKLKIVRNGLDAMHSGGGGGSMIEERLRNLESDVAVIKATMSTKDDIHSLRDDFNTRHLSIIKWMLGTALAVVSLIGGLMIGIANMLVKALG